MKVNSHLISEDFSASGIMVGDEPVKKTSTASKGNSPTPPTASDTLQLPVNIPGDKRETRASSPAGIPSELLSRADTQLSRVQSLAALKQRLPTCAPNTTMEELKVFSSLTEELNKAFQKEHAYSDAVCPRKDREHEYYRNNVLFKETELCFDIRLQIGKLKQELAPFQTLCSHDTAKSAPAPGKLPELALPTFTGDYLRWPAYSELFSALIGSSKSLTEIEKLQYLRSSLSGEPAQKVEALPLKGASFKPAWELLKETYSNKRLFIQAQLDKLFNTKPVLNKNAAALKQLISTVDTAQTSLLTLGIAEQLGDCILTYHVVRQLDKHTREAWETSIGS